MPYLFNGSDCLLKLVFCNSETRLRVREAFTGEMLGTSKTWSDLIEYSVTLNSEFTMLWTSYLPDLSSKYAQAFVNLVSARFPVSKNYEILQKECPELIFKNKSDEWVFYGGSFDPWHSGHQACLDLLPEEKVCLILPDRNPQKEIKELDVVSTILEISTKARFKKNQFLAPTFLIEQKVNPTIDWVERMRNHYPFHNLSLLIGFDSLKNISTWIRYKDILKIINTIYVASRLESDIDRKEISEELTEQFPKLKIIFLGRHDFENVSSTNLRNKKGRP